MILKSYDVEVRIPMTTAARNAGAIGRTHWWAYAGRIAAKSKRHACALMRKCEWAYADKLRAHTR